MTELGLYPVVQRSMMTIKIIKGADSVYLADSAGVYQQNYLCHSEFSFDFSYENMKTAIFRRWLQFSHQSEGFWFWAIPRSAEATDDDEDH